MTQNSVDINQLKTDADIGDPAALTLWWNEILRSNPCEHLQNIATIAARHCCLNILAEVLVECHRYKAWEVILEIEKNFPRVGQLLHPGFAWIPPGECHMGVFSKDSDWRTFPRRRVIIPRPLLVQNYAVSNLEYWAISGNNVGHDVHDFDYPDWQADNCATEGIEWLEAVRFCQRWSELEGIEGAYEMGAYDGTGLGERGQRVRWRGWSADGYRLPTEAEWMYATLGGGDTFEPLDTYGLVQKDPDKFFAGYGEHNHIVHEPPCPRGTKLPNSFGLYDLLGGVLEWCWDPFLNHLQHPLRVPSGPLQDWLVPHNGARDPFLRTANESAHCAETDHVCVGGGRYFAAKDCGPSNRWGSGHYNFQYTVGFRTVRSVELDLSKTRKTLAGEILDRAEKMLCSRVDILVRAQKMIDLHEDDVDLGISLGEGVQWFKSRETECERCREELDVLVRKYTEQWTEIASCIEANYPKFEEKD